jgi:hypothetical protein
MGAHARNPVSLLQEWDMKERISVLPEHKLLDSTDPSHRPVRGIGQGANKQAAKVASTGAAIRFMEQNGLELMGLPEPSEPGKPVPVVGSEAGDPRAVVQTEPVKSAAMSQSKAGEPVGVVTDENALMVLNEQYQHACDSVAIAKERSVFVATLKVHDEVGSENGTFFTGQETNKQEARASVARCALSALRGLHFDPVSGLPLEVARSPKEACEDDDSDCMDKLNSHDKQKLRKSAAKKREMTSVATLRRKSKPIIFSKKKKKRELWQD